MNETTLMQCSNGRAIRRQTLFSRRHFVVYIDSCNCLFTPSITVKSVPKTAPPKKELSESDKKALGAAVFDTGHKELSFGDDNSDLFTGASPATSKAQTSQ